MVEIFALSRSLWYLLAITLCCKIPPSSSQMRYKVTQEKGKALNQSLVLQSKMLTKPAMTMNMCLRHCLTECRCRSFQICNKTVCQLSWTNKQRKRKSFSENADCDYFDLWKEIEKETNQEQPDSGCQRPLNCCLTSRPCMYGGKCAPETSMRRRRFKCHCKLGYTGNTCGELPRSCRAFAGGTREFGKYQVFDKMNVNFSVYCDFDTSSNNTWTLVQSYAFNKHHKIKSFRKDIELNQDIPSWEEYRLSKARMRKIWNDSTKLRFTCNYDKLENVSDEHMIMRKAGGYGIFENDKQQCVPVEYIKVLGKECRDSVVSLQQLSDTALHAHCKINFTCFESCDMRSGVATGCNTTYYFGTLDGCPNKNHECSKESTSTSQTWFGGN